MSAQDVPFVQSPTHPTNVRRQGLIVGRPDGRLLEIKEGEV
jgi:hypothetical protein